MGSRGEVVCFFARGRSRGVGERGSGGEVGFFPTCLFPLLKSARRLG